jgi:ribbon-helix-helix CopG family protein
MPRIAVFDSVFQMCYVFYMRLREHVVLRIDSKSRKALERIAKREDDSVARIIRRAIATFLKRHKAK